MVEDAGPEFGEGCVALGERGVGGLGGALERAFEFGGEEGVLGEVLGVGEAGEGGFGWWLGGRETNPEEDSERYDWVEHCV